MESFPDFFKFIESHIKDDTSNLRLAVKKQNQNFDIDFAITQIECRQKYKSKLNDFLKFKEFLFPDHLSGEQASHQSIALYHSSLVNKEDSILDLTAGLGIDSLTMARKAKSVTSIELNEIKAKNLIHNIHALNIGNCKVINKDSIDFLKETDNCYDIIFVDPSRRDSSNKRVFLLHDCSPDVKEWQKLLLHKAKRILIKASPLLDISLTLKDFSQIYSISAIGVKGECKEILIELRAGCNSESPILRAINLDTEGNILSDFSFVGATGSNYPIASVNDLKEDGFILEPSAMVMKISPWTEICSKFKAKKFGKSSHLFVSDHLPVDFPGRVTRLKKILKKQDRKSLKGLPASVVSKNHPLSSEEIRKQLGLKEGDQNFIYASRIAEKPLFLLSESISR